MDSFTSNHLEQARNNSVYDLSQLDQLRQRGLSNDESALRAAAQQFEALFMNMLMKSMRQANKVFETEDNPLSSRDVEFFQDMYDNQLTSELSSQGTLGLADLMVQQLSPTATTNHTPASMLPVNRVSGAVHSTRHAEADNASVNNAAVGSASVNSAAVEFAKPQQPVTVPYQAATAITGEASNGRSDRLNLSQGEWRASNPMEFLEQLAPYAQQAAEQAGIAPESVLAQAALETGWGRYVVAHGDGSSNNLFNIKADHRWQGEAAQTRTTEYYDGKPQREQAFFRVYGSVAESFNDYVNFLQSNPRYQQALSVGQQPQQFVEALQQAGYATDPSYASKLQTIMNSDVMQQVRAKFGF
ncbi:MAG: flagellar assembly peptidoglycan hydrolase FlgJ [Gammaproteobacteria bacterium]|nr:flagellar assembly peptidoglycan hydrolase FlgJ [Gammaproteobacteria bacterium]